MGVRETLTGHVGGSGQVRVCCLPVVVSFAYSEEEGRVVVLRDKSVFFCCISLWPKCKHEKGTSPPPLLSHLLLALYSILHFRLGYSSLPSLDSTTLPCCRQYQQIWFLFFSAVRGCSWATPRKLWLVAIPFMVLSM